MRPIPLLAKFKSSPPKLPAPNLELEVPMVDHARAAVAAGAYIIRYLFVALPEEFKACGSSYFFRPATAMNSFREDTVIMAYDATNGIARDKTDILNNK
jgi:hypothetical protein